MFTIELEDVSQLQAETGKLENELRLRAIVAERVVKSLELEITILCAAKEDKDE